MCKIGGYKSGDVYDVDFFLGKEIQEVGRYRNNLCNKTQREPFYTWKATLKSKDVVYRMPVQNASFRVYSESKKGGPFEFHDEITLPEMKESAKCGFPVPQGTDAFKTVRCLRTIEAPAEHSRYLKKKHYWQFDLYTYGTSPRNIVERN